MSLQYFSINEFRCKCGCGMNRISMDFVTRLDCARKLAGVPFVITSGCRCPTHNRAVGGSAYSSHMRGLAADIRCRGDADRFHILNGLIRAGFTRIGVGSDFIHVDADTRKRDEIIWVYR